MVTLEITGLYAGLLALLFVGLSFNVIKRRFSEKVGLGDGGSSTLTKAIRIHGNFSEYIPLALILMALFEVSGGSEMWLHVAGGGLFFGRVMHALGLTKSHKTSIPRALGTIMTYLILVGLSIANVIVFMS